MTVLELKLSNDNSASNLEVADNMARANEYISKIDHQHIKFLEQIIQKPSISGSARQEVPHEFDEFLLKFRPPTSFILPLVHKVCR